MPREFATEHHELLVKPDATEILPTVVRHYGEPSADHAAIPTFYLARFAREHVTVALNGDGGDESFAGYQRYSTGLLLARSTACRWRCDGAAPRSPRRPCGAAATVAPWGD